MLFIMNTLLASVLVSELFCTQTIFHGCLPFTCLQVVLFNNAFTSGRKAGQLPETQQKCLFLQLGPSFPPYPVPT